jgi:hypothetical protein
MEKIIFLSLSLPVLGFVLYLGVSAILKGFTAKNEKLLEASNNEEEAKNSLKSINNDLSNELVKLSELLHSGALTKEEFEKAKKKILES